MTKRGATERPSQLARAALLALALAAAAAVGVLAAGCGGSSGEGVAQVDSGETTTTSSESSSGRSKRDALLAFSACMRTNGVPNFPDPQMSDSGGRLPFDPNVPGFKEAQQTCRRLLPNGGSATPGEQANQLQKALDYAACMRRNGVPNYPDPKASGGGGIEWGELGPRVGVDPDSPQFEAAEEACEEVAPGASGGGAERSTTP